MNENIASKTPQVVGEIDALCRVVDRFESLADRFVSKLSPVLRDPPPAPPAVPAPEVALVPVADAIRSSRRRLRNVADLFDEMIDRIEV